MSKQLQQAESLLTRWGFGAKLCHDRTLTSAVTTAWGVDWDEVFIARDLMQNFYDANRDRLDEVVVQTQGDGVLVTAPNPFNLERLFFLGSEKQDGDVGQYGEGFKVAATCLLRDHAVTPVAASGREVVALRVADRAVNDTSLYPVEYDFYSNKQEVPGTALFLPGCSKKLSQAIATGLTHFFYDNNPLLGAMRWSSHKNEFSVYDSNDGQGHVFYRKLKRGEVEGIPLVLVIDKQYKRIEQKVSKDRDRNAFGEEVMALFYQHFARYGLRDTFDGQRVVVEAARSSWQRGHPLLSAIAEYLGYSCYWPPEMANEVFGDRYYALASKHSDQANRLEIDRYERRWRGGGKVGLPGYFERFGVLNAQGEIERVHDKALEEAKTSHLRQPTPAEWHAIQLLSKVLRELAPEVMALFDQENTRYSVSRTEALLGQLNSNRDYRSREVFLAESVFVADFAEALAIFLHEHVHIFGYDGSRQFTDALTRLVEAVVRHRHGLEEYESAWGSANEAVQRERQLHGSSCDADDLDGWLSSLDEEALRALVKGLPSATLKRLRNVPTDRL